MDNLDGGHNSAVLHYAFRRLAAENNPTYTSQFIDFVSNYNKLEKTAYI